ncbi:hypothetical protein [Anaerococcus tetradius]|uniref:Uncharacterized protein n=1 Tax=Anaerococcus tetradius ATCC 35098 TaxID=525255 RepID=C2CHY1_9FIRM|nr:hypothetical protein [Anaerococcus tetradius]EEI82776.1 hypothetical protein HMPREF0077_1091 [Anaerococcus tetradius ATCC 35098]
MKNSNVEKKPIYKRKWFIVIAALIVIGAIFGPKDKDKKNNSQPAKVEEKQEEVKKEEPKKEEKEEKKEEYAITSDMTDEQKIENILKRVGGEQFESQKIDKSEDGSIRQVTLNTYVDPNTVWDINSAIKQQNIKTINALKLMKENNIKFNYFVLNATSTFTDKYGKDSKSEMMHIYISQEEADKINFEKFQEENLKEISDEYYVHPSANN